MLSSSESPRDEYLRFHQNHHFPLFCRKADLCSGNPIHSRLSAGIASIPFPRLSRIPEKTMKRLLNPANKAETANPPLRRRVDKAPTAA